VKCSWFHCQHLYIHLMWCNVMCAIICHILHVFTSCYVSHGCEDQRPAGPVGLRLRRCSWCQRTLRPTSLKLWVIQTVILYVILSYLSRALWGTQKESKDSKRFKSSNTYCRVFTIHSVHIHTHIYIHIHTYIHIHIYIQVYWHIYYRHVLFNVCSIYVFQYNIYIYMFIIYYDILIYNIETSLRFKVCLRMSRGIATVPRWYMPVELEKKPPGKRSIDLLQGLHPARNVTPQLGFTSTLYD
jgi:hypothetical protein